MKFRRFGGNIVRAEIGLRIRPRLGCRLGRVSHFRVRIAAHPANLDSTEFRGWCRRRLISAGDSLGKPTAVEWARRVVGQTDLKQTIIAFKDGGWRLLVCQSCIKPFSFNESG